ncbi:MAG: tetratricopeptide repeat protein, partial [Rhodopirellula sp. JB055]|uniref:tetratricopeptide repeat protein n=1 Tax=Rhodopirellula sp. JB055 TaxID=3342846 RepID=UPI00370B7778
MVVTFIGGCRPSDPTQPRADQAPAEETVAVQADRELAERLSAANEAYQCGQCDRAAELLTPLMIENPDHQELMMLVARVEAKRGKVAKALAIAEGIAEGDSKLRSPAIAFCVDAASKLDDPGRHERALRRWLEANPNLAEPSRRLWWLFMKQGRTFEAAQVADRLVFLGQANLPQLRSLVFRGQTISRPQHAGGTDSKASGKERFQPGQGRARHDFSIGDYQKARAELEAALAPDSPTRPINTASARALLGRVLAELQDDAAFLEWYSSRDSSLEVYDDYWFAIGSYHFDHGQYESAIHALLQALSRNSADLITYQRIQQSLKALQRDELSDAFEAKAAIIHESRELTKQLEGSPDRELLREIGNHLLSVGRPLESLRWTELSLPVTATPQLTQINQQRRRLQSVPELRQMMLEDAMVGLSPSQFKLQPIVSKGLQPEQNFNWSVEPKEQLSVRVDDVASQRGLKFQWRQATETDLSSIALYESLGGGVGVIDFDADGRPDLYFAQGAGDPPELHGVQSNQLFRN